MTNKWNKITNILSGLRGLGIIGLTDITGTIISALFLALYRSITRC